ncbi:hypothetical protein GYMLUDRAFT_44949 [Collybiopsis luxurians FD-317 M1]|uniref:Uncharacterized protein n=1 Tax=Collybiopsis luxurians FD-317 M1 TaxID=944289 RepID=A0A0D0CTS9_9AGAR|nr:hypothetical protein GYMLUDRAFT_44949 [Collybiopsis luxurians FD-317 M1]
MTSNGGRNSNSGFNGAPPKYLNDFSKALAGEVRILLEEVGKLRDERRQLQFEIAELMAVKSKHSLGGQYAPPEWLAKQLEPPPPAPASEEIVPAPPPQPAAPAWRTVHKRPERRPKSTKAIEPPQAPASPAPGPPPMPSGPGGPAWAQWRPNPLLSPAPRQGTPGSPFPAPPPPSRGGLFGPPSPPPK